MALSNDQLNNNLKRLQRWGKLKDYEFIGDTLIKYNGRATDLELPNCFSEVAESAFENNRHIRKVAIPESYVTIGAKAFWGCKCLKTVEFGNSVFTIYNSAFSNCGIWHLVINKGISSVGNLSFSDNEQLRIVEIESDSVWFEKDTFRGCNGVELLTMPKKLMVGEIGLDLDSIDIEYT